MVRIVLNIGGLLLLLLLLLYYSIMNDVIVICNEALMKDIIDDGDVVV
jgi:hypothetical protein